ncbi:putative lipoprotein [Ureaplasma urealyticum serovar 2 str. ATCC 27814]|uniref:hypothetical protein n=1 Tax=Ureaplasma urealyticum TaxID=2130 RepID=UPI0001794148|nr:hypothetical protein [Ureaplasma urealyticum]EEH02141.1 putative lipoprotein [Ureaplasma urealyticum serovar 2 str. ATCC 27814]
MKYKKYQSIWLKISAVIVIPLLITMITACARIDKKQKSKEELQSSLNQAVLLKEIVDQSSYEEFKKRYNQTLKLNLANIDQLSESKLKEQKTIINNLISQVDILFELDAIKRINNLIDLNGLENVKKQLEDFLNQYEKLLYQTNVDMTIINSLKTEANQKKLDTKAIMQKTILDLVHQIKNLIKKSGSTKKIDELEADIQNLISDTPKDDHLKFYKDFKIIYKKLNDFNYWINKEIKAQPFIKKLDDIVNVINTIYEQNHHFLWFDQTKLTNLRQILIKNINHVLNVKKTLEIKEIKTLTNQLLLDLQNYLEGLKMIALESENSINKLISIIESLQPDDYNPYYSIEKQENKQKDENNSQATYNGLEHQIKSLKSIINLFNFNITNLSIDAIYNLNDELIKKFQKANSQINEVVIRIKQTILSNFKQTYLFKDFIKHLKEFNIALNNENDPIKKANRIQTIQEVLKSYEKDLFLNTKINLKLAPNEVLTVNNLEKIDLTYSSDLLQKPQELIAYLELNNNQEREFSKELENLSVRVFTIIDKKLYIPKAKELINESKKIIQTKNEHTNNKTKLQRLEKFTSFVEQGISNENVSSYTLNLYIQRLTKLIQEIKKPQH